MAQDEQVYKIVGIVMQGANGETKLEGTPAALADALAIHGREMQRNPQNSLHDITLILRKMRQIEGTNEVVETGEESYALISDTEGCMYLSIPR